jgi:hypothetical protein
MPTRNQQKLTTASIVPGVRLDLNPFAQRAGTARLLRNWIYERGRLMRKPFSPLFQTKAATATGRVWDEIDFRFHRAGSPESQFLVVRSDGRIYRRNGGGGELEIFPGATTFSVLNARPKTVQLGNRIMFSDRSTAYIYDGRTFRRWGIPREASAMTTPSVVAGPGITAANGVNATFTWVVLDEAGNRVHESSRSNPSALSAALSNQKARLSIAAFTIPSGYGITHWSGYMSELNASGVRRRANTTRITTTTFDVDAFPAATLPREPLRNDPPGASLVMGQWRHRIAMRDESNKNRMWFTSFGEVKATNAGSPEESVSGRGDDSVSDLVNEFLYPDSEIRLIAEHANLLIVHTERNGYGIIGSAGVLDNLGTRGLSNEHFINEGAAGPHAGTTTPFGWAWMTPGRLIRLYLGGQQVLDIGQPIQPQLDTIPEGDLFDVTFFWWDGRGRKQLYVCCPCADSDNLSGTASWRAFVYDFDLGSEPDRPGEWSELTDHEYTVVKSYMDGDERFLVGGDTSGDVYQLDVIADPAHLNSSAILGKTYLGSTVQNNPLATMRTGLIEPSEGRNSVGEYLAIVRGSQDGPSTTIGTNPTVSMAADPIDPDADPGISLTLGSARDSGEFHAWLAAESGGDPGGCLAKQFQFELEYPAGANKTTDANGRETVNVEAIYKMSFAWRPDADIKDE